MGKSYDAVTAAFADAKKHPTTALLRQIAQEKRMTDLLARLQAATKGSAELDAEVLRAAGWKPARTRGFKGFWRIPSSGLLTLPPKVTTSQDAITWLIEARGWEWFKDRPLYYDTGTVLDGHAPLFYVGERGGKEWSQHKNDILALCIGFVSALEAQEGGA